MKGADRLCTITAIHVTTKITSIYFLSLSIFPWMFKDSKQPINLAFSARGAYFFVICSCAAGPKYETDVSSAAATRHGEPG